MQRVYVVATADTKGEELAFLADRIVAGGYGVVRVDVGTRSPTIAADISIAAIEMAAHHPADAPNLLGGNDRGQAVTLMGAAFRRFIAAQSDIAGIVGIGGGGGTSIITNGMRALPLGIPKIMVSTLASGDVGPYVGLSDIIMMPSITDLAGLNRISRAILHNAAQAMIGMVAAPASFAVGKPAIGLTMFGVTTPCVTAISEQLRDEYDCLVFHATGTGGRSMEGLVDSGLLNGVIDITTTEVCDLLLGGVLAATEDRFGAITRTKIPYVGSVGALDMVNFWARHTISPKYGHRKFYEHNPNVTLMRTTASECARIGVWIAERLNQCEGEVRFLIPEKGVSALDVEGGAFYDRQADDALFYAIEATFVETSKRKIKRLPLHINDPKFAAAAVAAFKTIAA